MRFNLSVTAFFYTKTEKELLEPLGFRFEYNRKDKTYMVSDKDVYININNLADLLNLTAKYGQVVIDEENIEIYNDWRE